MVLEKSTPVTRERNWGIDLLRIVSMFMVVLLHILGPGGIIYESGKLTPMYNIVWLVEMMAFCAVNCYGLISGFVGVDTKFKYSNFVLIWLQVVFYTVGITLFFHFKYPDTIPLSQVIRSAFPVSHNFYWYFTAYAGLFFLMPLLNKGVKSLSKKQAAILIITMFFGLSVLPLISGTDPFRVVQGYSTVWLIFLYLVGAYVKLHGLFKSKIILPLILYAAATFTSWGMKLYNETVAPCDKWNELASGVYVQYSAPMAFISGLAIFLIFSQIKLSPKAGKVISFISASSFGVYIIHNHPLMWDRLITYKYASYVNLSIPKLLGAVLLTAICFFAVLSLVDTVRLLLFKLLKLKPLLQKAENKILGEL